VNLDVNTILTAGRTVRGIVEGDAVSDVFTPRLIELWRQGRFPVDRLMHNYDFDQLDEAPTTPSKGASSRPACECDPGPQRD
jgi:aryl-alcohol dehydrogenase